MTPAPPPPAVRITGADLGYGRAPVLSGVDLHIEPGGFIGAVGPSGSGKTTLIRALTGGCRLLRGGVSVFGAPVRHGRPSRDVGYVPQVGAADTSFPITVEQVALQGLGNGLRPWHTAGERHAARAILARLGLEPLARQAIAELSGGELQRAFLARALVRRPRLLLLDEPTSGVDLRTRHDVLHLLAELNAEGMTVVLTTHDLNFVATHLPRLVCLAGRVVADGPPEAVLHPPVLRATYGAEVRVIHDGNLVLVADPAPLLAGAGQEPAPAAAAVRGHEEPPWSV
ncbi:ABC-type Mn2+/Zn2+ transport system ATPase subunit [Lipingzhangella halophila]|uniref:ABC-type Mn2+/Zn2+ transport system ATPase subunit n=1 Tax=Lipingzhangella halophila TaxID=1783352 RepID=A0A7W7RN91_9ACTN|nr:metal ABC transporter ATP-binding protein [Lipingzhangella halophila]MBB4934882.1 ABC-type Mn2+/Zn2+ transport system ATPase subunit [Lipingzhangella halophila]